MRRIVWKLEIIFQTILALVFWGTTGYPVTPHTRYRKVPGNPSYGAPGIPTARYCVLSGTGYYCSVHSQVPLGKYLLSCRTAVRTHRPCHTNATVKMFFNVLFYFSYILFFSVRTVDSHLLDRGMLMESEAKIFVPLRAELTRVTSHGTSLCIS